MNRIERDIEIVRLWEEEALSLQEIGSRFGITRERTRQILRHFGASEANAIRENRKVEKKKLEDLRVKEILENSITVIKALYDSGATKTHAINMLAILFGEYDKGEILLAVEKSKLRFQQATVSPKFSDEFVLAGVHWVLGVRNDVLAGREETVALIEEDLLTEFLAHGEEGLLPAIPIEEILRRVVGARIEIGSSAPLSLSHAAYEETRITVWDSEGWAGSIEAYWPPTKQTVMKRLGGGYWNDAMDAIGIAASVRKGRPRGLLLYSESDYHRAIRDYYWHRVDLGLSPTHLAYTDWVKGEQHAGDKRPSAISVRNFFGNWTRAIQIAQQES
jgi:hypothetical protein